MVTVFQGEIWWATLPEPQGSEPGYRRPVVVVQGDGFNVGQIATVVCVTMTSNIKWALSPGNLLLSPALTGLPKDSVANVSQVTTVDRNQLEERVGKLPRREVDRILAGIDVVLGR